MPDSDAQSEDVGEIILREVFPAAYTPHEQRPAGSPQGQPQNMRSGWKPQKQLKTRDRLILTLELRGKTKTEIARQLQISTQTVGQVTHSERYLAAREELLREADDEFIALKPAAVAAIRCGLDSVDQNVALRASETWMKAAGFGQYGKGIGIGAQPLTAEDVARQLLQVNVSINVDGSK